MSPIYSPLFYCDRQLDPFYVSPATQSNRDSTVLNSPQRVTYYALIRALHPSHCLYGTSQRAPASSVMAIFKIPMADEDLGLERRTRTVPVKQFGS